MLRRDTLYYFLLIPIALGFAQAETNVTRVRTLVHARSRKNAQKVRRCATERLATTRNSLSAVGDGRWLHAAIFPAQNPVAFSYFPRRNVAAPWRVKLIGFTSHVSPTNGI